MKDLHLYIHIPFCRRKCVYCDFYSVCRTDQIPQFCTAVTDSLKFQGNIHAPKHRVKSIYFGGGTPNLLSTAQLQRICSSIRRYFHVAEDPECTIEINPEFSKSRSSIKQLRDLGFNRLSIGVQSLQDRELRLLGRLHSSRTALRCLKHARNIFDNISVDLIYAIPGQSLKDLKHHVNRLLAFSPEHISAYNLSCEEGTPLAESVTKGDIRLADEESEREHFLFLHEYLSGKGYEHYEISNFARPGFHSQHNSAYWHDQHYLGIGPSAHSMLDNIRYHFTADLQQYLEKPENFSYAEPALESERIITGLRTKKGLDLTLLEAETSVKLLKYADKHPGWLSHTDSRLFCTLEGWLVLDSILADLI
jgi:oxygen-independent coproporphyrinogen III oxidase